MKKVPWNPKSILNFFYYFGNTKTPMLRKRKQIKDQLWTNETPSVIVALTNATLTFNFPERTTWRFLLETWIWIIKFFNHDCKMDLIYTWLVLMLVFNEILRRRKHDLQSENGSAFSNVTALNRWSFKIIFFVL